MISVIRDTECDEKELAIQSSFDIYTRPNNFIKFLSLNFTSKNFTFRPVLDGAHPNARTSEVPDLLRPSLY